MSDEAPQLKRSKRTSRIPLDVWRDSFLGLDRFSLDACQICTRSFRSLLDEFAPDICRRQLREADIRYRAADLCGNGTAGFSAALFATDDHSVHVTEKDIQSFKRKLKKVAGQSRIDSIDINGKMPADKLNEFVEASEEIFSGIQVDQLGLIYDAQNPPERCHQMVLAVAPRGCELFLSNSSKRHELRSGWWHDSPSVPDTFLTGAFLMNCSAAGMIRFGFDEFVPETERAFQVSDEAIVQFLFGNPRIEGQRKLTLSAVNLTSTVFKRIVEASFASEITDDISLDMVNLAVRFPQTVENVVDTAEYDEYFLDYDDADTRCDSTVQFEFPGEIRLQIFLFIYEEQFRMRRGRRRGWEWVPKEARKTQKNWEAENYTESEWEEMGFVDFFLGHSDYTD
ncbi:hypothetical protein AAVH_13949 [Aphelenchoides avenae]|nr:hypothetical protein AAVH_13949 [Aphelenchus avenae]